jgi:hypothetical protein
MDDLKGDELIFTLHVTKIGNGLYSATSPQVAGLFLCGHSLDEVFQVVPEGLAALDEAYREDGKNPWPAVRAALTPAPPPPGLE